MSADEYRDDRPDRDRWPPGFDEWPREEQMMVVAERYSRSGLLRACLSHAGLDPTERAVSYDRKLTKKELASIYLTLEGISHDPER